jgi:hypothetical protein
VFLRFFRLGVLAFEVSKHYVERLVTEPDMDRPYAVPLHLTSR